MAALTMLETGGRKLVRWRSCELALLRSVAVARCRCCAVSLLREREGGEESENVIVKLPPSFEKKNRALVEALSKASFPRSVRSKASLLPKLPSKASDMT